VSDEVVDPVPSSPSVLFPHAHTVPSVLTARECNPPAAMADTPVRTCTGVVTGLVVPFPTSPSAFLPHAQTSPLSSRASIDSPPAATAMIGGSPLTCTGRSAWAVDPVPKVSLLPVPHVHTLPLASNAADTALPIGYPSAVEATWTTLVNPGTWTGVIDDVVVPFPSSPWAFAPDVQTVPSGRNAVVHVDPPATAASVTGCAFRVWE
jgi:hypothetical protein